MIDGHLRYGPQRRRYGWKLSPADNRDKRASLPELIMSEVDLSANVAMPAVWDQGQLGSCTANAVCAALQFDCSLDRRLAGLGNCHRRSRLDLYYGERSLEGTLADGDCGAYGRDGFKYAQQTGVLLEQVWPYDVNTFEGPPPSGKRHLLTKSYAVVPQGIDEIKAVLSNQQTIAFGFTVYESFEGNGTATSGIVTMPAAGEQELGGHEMLIVGYLGSYPKYALVRNSWGSGWGRAGYCLFPWQYLLDASLCGDFRTIVRPTT